MVHIFMKHAYVEKIYLTFLIEANNAQIRKRQWSRNALYYFLTKNW